MPRSLCRLVMARRRAAVIAATCALALPLVAGAQAGDSGFAVTVGFWDRDIAGQVGQPPLDLREDLGLRGDTDLVLDATLRLGRFEVLADHARLRADGDAIASQDISLGGITLIPLSSPLRSRAEVDDSTLVARWRFDLGGIEVAPGLTARYLDGDVRVQEGENGGASNTVESFAELFPMLHLSVGTDLGPLRLDVRGNYIEFDGDRVFDVRAAAWLQPAFLGPLRLGLAWQVRDYRVFSGSDQAADIRVDGTQFLIGARW